MRWTLAVHILAGSAGLITGFIALFVVKGGTIHRRVGMAFVYSMLTMAVAGGTIAIVRNTAPRINVPAALLTAYLVLTSLIALRPPSLRIRFFTIGAMVVVLPVALYDLTVGVELLGTAKTRPFAFPFFMFATVGLLATIGDIRVIRSGALQGSSRIARHLWRMSFALVIASLSFFIGQAKVIPAPIRIMPLLATPILVALGGMFYWLWRVRMRSTLRGLVMKTPSRRELEPA